MFTAYIVVTLLAAAANTFSAALDFTRYKQADPHQYGQSRRVGVVANNTRHSQGRGSAWTTDRHPRATDRDSRCGRPCPVLSRRDRHASARSRLLVRSGGCVPPAGHRRAGTAIGLAVSRETLGSSLSSIPRPPD